ncbi:hypothetical protein H6G62_07810 [Phormidium sp. FACHB-1136]|nr:hypothetical protein [Phormidium sp. FACHB-1136]
MREIGSGTGLIRPSISSVLRLSPWLIVMTLGWANAAMAQAAPRVSEGVGSEDIVSEDIRAVELPISDSSGNVVLSIDSTNLEAVFESPTLVETEEESITVQDNLYLLRESADEASLRETFTQANLLTQATDSADEIPWRFSIEPFFYVPFGANGDVTVRGISAPINAGISDTFSTIVNDLNFAAFGRFEAWKGPWGIFFGGAYVNLGTGQTATIPVPPALQQVGLPPQATLSAAAGTSFVQLDLGGAYRFGDSNLATALRTADTEFDLGPFVFDALAGVRFYSFNNNLVLTGPLGNQFEFDQSKTSFEPMLGGRARWNLSHNLAALAGGSMSGFGLGDLTFSAAGYAGVDWLFSGNTSLLASYGFTYLDYTSGNSGVNLFTHGPNIGVKFRF